jgi:hypothetical protein
MTESKKAWVTPELIVLVRSKPEEAVLGVCKNQFVGDPGATDNSCAISSCSDYCFTHDIS